MNRSIPGLASATLALERGLDSAVWRLPEPLMDRRIGRLRERSMIGPDSWTSPVSYGGRPSCVLLTAVNDRSIIRPARGTRNFERRQRPPAHPGPARSTASADALAAIVRIQAFG